MLNNQTTQKLHDMRLSALANEYRRQMASPDSTALSFEERFGMLVDAEWISRQNSRVKKLLHGAALRIPEACIEDIDYDPQRKLDRGYVVRLADCSWISEHRNLIITGATGTGKTWLACAFGNAACRQGFKVKYYRVNRLLTDLAIGRGDGSYNKLMLDIKKTDLLILDDWGMAVLDPVLGRDLLEVVEDRCGIKSTIIAGQLPVSDWHAVFEDSTVADAVLDRLVHNAHRLALCGPSKRRPNEHDEQNCAAGIGDLC
ncbi:MAG: transposase [Pelotomaculum sp. PtaB.Bin104]|nr:MAG: transposase [Pelotomaculum sp. PtaB.Bin104]